MKRVKNKKNIKKGGLSLLVILLLLGISLGYAYLTKTLTINGLAKIEANTWKIQWSRKGLEKIESKTTNSASEILEEATITSSEEGKDLNDVVTFSVKLDKPGDSYSVELFRENAGTIDAILDSYTVEGLEGTDNYLTLTLDDSEAEEGFEDESGYGNLMSKPELPHGKENKIKLTLKFEEDITEEDLLDEAANLTVKVKLNYIQALE